MIELEDAIKIIEKCFTNKQGQDSKSYRCSK